ncbi:MULTISPECIES: CHAP domain-containing protein [unclassified Streptococcus]|uniref:CHAP domain-containing protein n=1 Tax=unclassified Streptococcus TaxID=2608887 RepID=UPI0011B69826|nr:MULTISPECIES: CHAP domain-containing protein [unclassified Streptococcus]TWS94672.1 CHAP domain-containing protein [Streptococcus sp. sy018]TWT14506.1 CHAP domain-containing protein [Streptococcus sp. sy010]
MSKIKFHFLPLLVVLSFVLVNPVSAASKTSVINWAENLARSGQGVDYDGVYGWQCVDIVNWVLGKQFGKPIWGNAINLLDSAQQAGYTIIRNDGNAKPQAGDLFVMQTFAHSYGHAGLVVADNGNGTYRTIEQNVDGGATALTLGGPARQLNRRLSSQYGNIIGWIRPPYDNNQNLPSINSSTTVVQNTNSSSSSTTYKKLRNESGRFTVTVSQLNVRNSPSTSGSPVATYSSGQYFNYDSVYQGDGYLWLSYVSHSGVRRYVAQGPEQNGVLTSSYGRVN